MNSKVIDTVNEIKNWPAFPSKQRATWFSMLAPYLAESYQINQETSATVFNVASGTGHASFKLQELYPKFTIWDFDIAEIPPEQQFRNFIQTDYHHLPVEENVADLLFCFFGLDYSPDQAQAVQEWQRVTKDGGFAFVVLHSPYSNIVSRLSEANLKITANIIKAYEKNDYELFYSMYDFYFYNISQLKKLVTLAEKYNFIKSYYELSNFLFNRRAQLFSSPEQIRDSFYAHGFEEVETFLIQHEGQLLKPSTGTNYSAVPHDGWFVVLKK